VKIGIFYGSTYGNTASVAEQIGAWLERLLGQTVPVLDIARTEPQELEIYDQLLLGCSTWNVGELQDDWDAKFRQLEHLKLMGKHVALFGMGDQLGYGESFCDALGILGEKLEELGATLVGFWPVAGYEHYKSRGQRGGFFMGLALDDDNQHHLTKTRIERWMAQVVEEFSLAVEVKR
jgi:flavodoxin I